MEGIQCLISVLHLLLDAEIRMQRSVNATIHEEIILIDKDQINAQGQIW